MMEFKGNMNLRIEKIRASLNRLGSAWLIFALLAGNFSAVMDAVAREHSYRIPGDTASILGHLTGLSSKLSFDQKANAFRFNSTAVDEANKNLTASSASADSSQTGVPDAVKAQLAAQQQQLTATTTKDKDPYGVDIPVNSAKGITFADTNSKLAFDMVPQFNTDEAREVNNRVVYPISGTDQQVIYTLKNNGIKEDIVLNSAPNGGALDYAYTLKLPDTLVAKLLPDGSVGIYSADPALFGEISASTPDDQAMVDKARKNAAKDHLVFGLPAPVIHESGSAAAVTTAQAHFELSGTTLRVKASGLSDKLSYPVSVDPSVVVSTTADFAKGNNEGNIDFSTADQINRGGLTGGTVGAWAATSTMNSSRQASASVAYNGFVYAIGGYNGSSIVGSVEYAPLNSNGTVGTWVNNPNSLNTARYQHSAVAYNGYLYVIGGDNTGSSYLNSIEYALICTGSNSGVGGCTSTAGSVGTWVNNSTFLNTARRLTGSVVYNGYVYVVGGAVSVGSYSASVEYASIKADGSVGSWTQNSNSLNTARMALNSVVYNGYIYALCGFNGSALSSVEYAPLNSNGSTGTWATTGSLTTARKAPAAVVNNGFIYVMGGSNTSESSYFNTIEYASINANGTLSWSGATSSLTANRGFYGAASYNGYIYAVGGYNGSNLNTVEYAPLKQSGGLGNWNSTTSLSFSNGWAVSLAYNGYIYLLGRGTTVQYTSVSSDGTLGSWLSATSLPSNLQEMSGVAYNGYIYVLGGLLGGSSVTNAVSYVNITTTGALGSWTSTTSLPTNLMDQTSIVYNGYIYVMGGRTSLAGSPITNVRYVQINSGGSLGATWNSATGLPSGVNVASSVVYGGYAYVIGGTGSSADLSSVYYVSINSDGSLNSWSTSSNSLPQTVSQATAVVYNGYIYSIGGYVNGVASSKVYYAAIGSSGSVSQWSTTSSLPGATVDHSSVVYNGYVYSIGGGSAGQSTNVYFAQISTVGAGVTGAWSNNNAFTTGRQNPTSVAYNGYIYVIGGSTDGGQTASIEYASIGTNGVLTWLGSPGNLAAPRHAASAVAYNGFLYVLGGYVSGGTISNSVVYATIGSTGTLTWNGSPGDMSTTRVSFGAFAYNGYMYAIGGYGTAGNIYLNTVEYATIGSSGALTWNGTSPGNMSIARGYFGSVLYGGYIYILGGNDGSALNGINTVEYARINSNGTLTWALTSSLSDKRCQFAALAYDGYLYIMGGSVGGSTPYFNTTEYARINSNGTLTWLGALSSLNVGRVIAASVTYGGYLYVLGGYGYSGGSYGNRNSVEYAKVNNGGPGTTGTWTQISSGAGALNTARLYQTSVVYNGYAYAIAGSNGAEVASVEYSQLSSNGAPGSWTQISSGTGALNTARYNHSSVVYNGYIYAIGGRAFGGPVFASVEYSKIGSNGVPGAWTQISSGSGTLNTARYGQSSVVYNGYVYVIGGYNSGNTALVSVEYAQLGSNGVPGAWTQISSGSGALNTARGVHSSVVYNGYAYAIGGFDASSNYLSSVEYSQLGSNGIPGAWVTTSRLSIARTGHTSVAYDGYIYAISGESSPGTNTIEYSQIGSNGALGVWTISPNSLNATTRRYHSSVVYNGYVYAIGGCNNVCGTLSSVEYAPLNVQPRVGSYSKLIDLGSDQSLSSLVYNGVRLGGGVVNMTVKSATSASPTFGAAATYNNVTPGATTTLSGSGRYVQVTATIDDSGAGSFADSVAGQSYITDMTVTGVTLTSFYYSVKPTSGTAGGASTVFTVGAKDDSGNVMAVPSNTTVYLYSSSGTGTFSATSGGTYTSALSVVITSGGFTTDFYYKDNTAGGPYTIYASDQSSFPSSDTGIVDATTSYTVNAAAASVAVLSPSTQTVTANNPSAVYTLTTKDAFGNVSNVVGNQTFALSDAASGQFSVLSSPFTPVGNVTVNNNTSSTTFYYKASVPGSYTIGAVLGGFTSGSTGVTVNQATITSYYYTTSPSTGTAGSASTVFTVGAHDSNGNVVVVASNTPVYLYSSGSGGLFSSPGNSTFTATSATISAGGTTANFYYKNNSTSGSPYTITVSDNSSAPDGGTGIADATTSYAVTAGTASQYTLTPSTQTVTANNPSSVITLTAKDSLGNVSNVVGNQTFTLSDGASGQFSLTNSPFTPVTTVTVNGGTSSVTFYYRATVPGTYTITATLSGFSATSGGNAVMTVNQATITQYYYNVAPASGAAGAASTVFTIGAKDVNGNVVTVASNTPVYLYSSGSGGTFSTTSGGTYTSALTVTITSGGTATSFYYKNNSTSGSPYTITASDNATAPDGATGIVDATTSYTVNPGTASVAVLTPSSQSATAGSPSSVITLTTKDSLGNAVAVGSNATFTLSDADGGAFSLLASPFTPVGSVTVTSGQSTATFYYRNNTSGSYTLTAHNAGFTDGTSSVTVNSGAIASYYFVSAPSSVNINVSSAAFTVGAHDVFGNVVTVGSNTTVYLYSTHGSGTFSNSGSGGPFTATNVTITTGNSTANFNYKDSVAVGSVTLTASDQTPTHTPDTGIVDANVTLSVIDPDIKVGPNLPIPHRSATTSDSRPGDPNVHLSWNSDSVNTIKAIRVMICTDGLKNTACTGPTGADLTPVTLTNTSGELGFSGWSITSVVSAHEILITNATGAATTVGGTSAIDLGNFVNPTSIGTFFFRISTYTTTAAAPADSVSYGAIASSTNRSLTVTSGVSDTLIFRVANAITTCDGVSETNIPDPNDAGSDLVNLSPSPATANATSTGTAQFCVVTNAPNGYAVTYADWGASSYDAHAGFWNGSHEFNPGGISAFTSTPGVEQFGFKVTVAGAGSGTVTAPYNAATYNYNDSGSAVQVASASASSAANIFTVSYVANISGITPGGTYRAHQMFVITASF